MGLVCSALVGSGLVCSALVGSGLVCSALVGSGLVCPTWTWPSISSPDSYSAPPPSWIVLCVEHLEAVLGGGALSRIRFMSSRPLTTLSLAPHYSCISHSCHQSLICTNHTASLRQARFISLGLHLSHCEVLFSHV